MKYLIHNTTLLLFCIVLLASVLRFVGLGSIPASPDWDEVAIGYNAYSLLQTGRDEYGKTFPVILRSFDDYKPALYAYLDMPFIRIFGLNVTAVRLPSALFGVLSVVLIFFLVKELLKRTDIALVASCIAAISPWQIQFSRVGFESNIGLSINLLAAFFFLKGLKKPWMLCLSAAFFAANLYMYQSEKVFTPLLLFVLCFLFRKELFSVPKKYILAAIFVGFIVTFPIVYETLTNKQALSRAQGVSVFADQNSVLKESVTRFAISKSTNDSVGEIFNNRRIVFAKTVIGNYLSHFDLNWLFISGDIPRHHAPNMGLLYIWELPFLLAGIYFLLFSSYDKRAKLFFFSWLLLSPIPASVTTGVPHAVRTLNMVFSLNVFTALGFVMIVQQILRNIFFPRFTGVKKIAIFFLLVFIVFNVAYYLDQYFVQQNYFYSQDWQFGYKDSVAYAKKVERKYDKIIVSSSGHLDQSYIFFLFYLHYSPEKYQSERLVAPNSKDFDKYVFRPIHWMEDRYSQHTLFIGSPSEFPQDIQASKVIYFLDGSSAITIIGT